jgi:hypothetical protein
MSRDPKLKTKGAGPNGGLLAFTGSTVAVRFGLVLNTYGKSGDVVL